MFPHLIREHKYYLMKKIFLLAGLALFFVHGSSQNHGAIHGSVIDKTTKEPLFAASVYIEFGGEIMGTTTDFDGNFVIKPVPPGLYDLNIRYVGYNTLVIEKVRVLPDKITFEKKRALEPIAIGLPAITIKVPGRNPLINFDDPKKTVMLQAEIEKRADSKNLKSMVSNLGGGITVANNGRDLHFRGSRAMAFNYYVDGVKITADQQVNIPSRAISSISVYAGGVPAKYGDITGGVVIIETMTYQELYNRYKANTM